MSIPALPGERLLALLEAGGDGHLALDRECRCVYANTRAASLLGVPLEALVGSHPWQDHPQAASPALLQACRRALDGSASVQAEHYLAPCAGWFDVRILPTADGVNLSFTDVGASRQAELLREESKRFRGTLDSILEGCQLIGFDWRYIYLNDAAAAHNRRPNADLLGRTMMEMWPGIEGTDVFAMLRRSMEERVALRQEVDFVFPDGGNGWFDVSSQPVPEGIFVLSIDISERRRAEQALRASNRLLEDSQAIARIGGWEIDIASQRLAWTAETYRIHETTPGEFEPTVEGGVELFMPGSRRVITEAMRAAMEHGTGYDLELEKLTLRGRRIDVRTTCRVVYADGVPVKLTGIIQDITGRKQAEAALRDSEARLRLALDAARMGTFDWDLPGNHIEWSRWHEHLWGFEAGTFDGSYASFASRVHPGDLPGLEAEVARCIASRSAFDREFRVSWPDGSLHWIRATGEFSFGDAGQPLHMRGVVTETTASKQRELALRRSEQWFHAIFDQAAVGIVIVDPATGRFLSVNQRFADINGHSMAELLGMRFQDITHPEDLPGDFPLMAALRAGEIPSFSRSKRYIRPDGQTVWVQITVSALRGEGEFADCNIAIVEDIDDRMRAEHALQESRQRLAVVFDNLIEGLAISDAEGRQLSMNPAGLRMHGLTAEETSRLGLLDFDRIFELSPLDGDPLPIGDWPMSRVLRGETVNDLEIRIRRRDRDWERVFRYSGAVARLSDGRIQGFLIISDITERKNAEALRLAVAGADIGTWHWDIAKDQLLWSERCKAIFGIPPGEAMSYPRFLASLHPDDRDATDAAVKEALARHDTYDVEMRSLWPDGSVHWAASRGRGYYDADGKPLRMEGVAVDITRRKQEEAELHAVRRQLEHSNQELQAFSYSVSHDLRAPLRGIDGWSQALLEDHGGQLDAQGREYLQRVRAETQHMGRLIDCLLELSRVSQSPMRKAPVDLTAIALAVGDKLREAEPGREVDFIVQPGLRVFGDADLLRVALTNLLGNAWKFTRGREPGRIELGLGERDGESLYFVRDNGAGFDMRHAGKLFSPFQRMHRQSEFPGTGIGLALVQRIIGRHGGRIEAQSAVRHGTTFWFTLGGEE